MVHDISTYCHNVSIGSFCHLSTVALRAKSGARLRRGGGELLLLRRQKGRKAGRQPLAFVPAFSPAPQGEAGARKKMPERQGPVSDSL